MAFQGSLEELSLPDVIQLVAGSGKSGIFKLESEVAAGEIVLRDGQIVHASCGDLSGEEAFYDLATWQEGSFRFAPGGDDAPVTIEKSNTNLLMAAAQRIDEWKVLVSRVPSTNMVPVFREDGGTTPISLTPREWQVIRKIDESRSIDEISATLKLSPFEVAKTIYGLITSGLVDLTDDPSKFPFDRLHDLDGDALKSLAGRIQATSGDYLKKGGLAAETNGSEEIAEASADAETMIEWIRERERLIASSLGPHQAQAFLASVGRLIEQQ